MKPLVYKKSRREPGRVPERHKLHIAKGYTYFAMGFSVVVEMLNIRMRAKAKPLELRRSM